MKRSIEWRGIALMILTGMVAGLLNIALSSYVTNALIGDVRQDEVAVSTYAINLFVGWVFFSAWFLSRADDEYKKVVEAVLRKDRVEFLIEAPKRIATSIRVLYLVICLLVVFSFHLFHLENQIVLSEIHFGVGFIVAMTIFVLWDLDDPVGGIIYVPDIPQEWLKELAAT